jgi:hypothetical protein
VETGFGMTHGYHISKARQSCNFYRKHSKACGDRPLQTLILSIPLAMENTPLFFHSIVILGQRASRTRTV